MFDLATVVNERHYTVKELADMWNFSATTIREAFKNEDGVLRWEGTGTAQGKRPYISYSIPESVALRVYKRLGQKPLKTTLPRRNPRRIVLLRDGNRRVA